MMETLAPRFNKLVIVLVLQKMHAHMRGVLPVTPASSMGMAAFSINTSARLVWSSKIAVVNAFRAILLLPAPFTSELSARAVCITCSTAATDPDLAAANRFIVALAKASSFALCAKVVGAPVGCPVGITDGLLVG